MRSGGPHRAAWTPCAASRRHRRPGTRAREAGRRLGIQKAIPSLRRLVALTAELRPRRSARRPAARRGPADVACLGVARWILAHLVGAVIAAHFHVAALCLHLRSALEILATHRAILFLSRHEYLLKGRETDYLPPRRPRRGGWATLNLAVSKASGRWTVGKGYGTFGQRITAAVPGQAGSAGGARDALCC